jgi:cold shock CspA family protein
MQLSQVLQQFKISPKQFEDILSKHQIKAQAKFLKVVPVEWLTIINEELQGSSFSMETWLASAVPGTHPMTAIAGTPLVAGQEQTPAEALSAKLVEAMAERTAALADASQRESLVRRSRPARQETTPAEDELQLGQVTSVVAEKGFGFLRSIHTYAEIFWHVTALEKLPAENDWLWFAKGPGRKDPNQPQVRWAQPLGQDKELQRRVLDLQPEDMLHRLLEAGPVLLWPGALRELVERLPAIDSNETLQRAVQTLHKAGQRVPDLVTEAVRPLLKRTPPAYAWHLWLRYRSPLATETTVANRLTELLAAEPAVAANWLPQAQQTGLVGLLLSYLSHGGKPVPQGLEQLKAILGPRDLYQETLRLWLRQAENTQTAAEFRLYRAVARLAPEATGNQPVSAIYGQLPPAAQVEAWLSEPDLEFPRAAALEQFASVPLAAQDQIAAMLDDTELLVVLGVITQEHAEQTRQRARTLLSQHVLTTLKALGLDLESDGREIHEIAWGTPGGWHVGRDEDSVARELSYLRERTNNGELYLLVGHNVRDFDAEILANYSTPLPLPAGGLWDTLLLEMALSPGWRVLALRTRHQAQADAELALRLFTNQVLRLLRADSAAWEILRHVVPAAAQTGVGQLREQRLGQWLTDKELHDEAQSYLRPQPQLSALLRRLQEQVAQTNAPVNVLLAAREFWSELYATPDVRFLADEETETNYRELAAETVLAHLASHPTERAIAQRFFSYCQQQRLAPVPATLGTAARIRLQAVLDFEQCRAPQPAAGGPLPQLTCLTAQQLRRQPALLTDPTAAVFVVEADVITLTNKTRLPLAGRDSLTSEDLISSPATKTAWMKFSGGQSYVGLSREQALELGASVPPDYRTLWLEKHRYGEYRIWGSFPWEQLLHGCPSEQLHFVQAAALTATPEQMRCAVVDARRLQQRLGVTAFNPETIYRSRYWLLQVQLLTHISQTDHRPTVLLVQRAEEIEPLERYCRQAHGYFIPERAAALGRRLELLHQHPGPRRLLITTARNSTALLEANYLGPLHVVVESFNLLENFYLAQGSRLFEQAQEQASELALPEDAAEDDAPLEDKPATDAVAEILARDLFFLLKLQQPVVRQLLGRLRDNHTDHRLWLLDPRLGDFPALETAWKMTKRTYDVPWATVEEYTQAAQAADQLLGGVRPADFQLNLPEAKQLLQQVFLAGNSWYDIQHQYLDKILPAETDMLVSLPTGGGKSLLFQAPALYRSAYTNRLSVVVTPLKALMEDQVEKLWDLGFYSSVEFINQDKQDELPQIYRRLAGGEISLLFITPERFRSGAFTKAFLQRFTNDGGLEYAIYDEAHCISQWGHEFRPDYLHSARVVERYRNPAVCPRRFPVLLFSATVSEKIYASFNELFSTSTKHD